MNERKSLSNLLSIIVDIDGISLSAQVGWPLDLDSEKLIGDLFSYCLTLRVILSSRTAFVGYILFCIQTFLLCNLVFVNTLSWKIVLFVMIDDFLERLIVIDSFDVLDRLHGINNVSFIEQLRFNARKQLHVLIYFHISDSYLASLTERINFLCFVPKHLCRLVHIDYLFCLWILYYHTLF